MGKNQENNLDIAIKNIEKIINKSFDSPQFSLEIKSLKEFQDLEQSLIEVEPDIIHFTENLDTPKDNIKIEGGIVNRQIIESLISSLPKLEKYPECIILDNCYSDSQATTINQYSNYVLGTQANTRTNTSTEFHNNFYGSLGKDGSIENAYRSGINNIQLGNKLEDVLRYSPFHSIQEDESITKIPKPNSLVRYPNLECPSSSVINKRFSIFVEILIDSPEPNIQPMMIEDTGIPNKLPEVEIVIRARSFDIEGSNTKKIKVPRDDDTEARFILIPRKLGEQEIRVDFYQNDERISTIRKNILIKSNDNYTKEEIEQPQNNTCMDLKNDFSVPPADLELCIELDKNDNRTLYFTLHSSKANINYHHKEVGDYKLLVSPKEKMKSIYDKLSHLAEKFSRTGTPIGFVFQDFSLSEDNEEHEYILKDEGRNLWNELIPRALKKEYWKFKDKVNSFLITSDEPWIPWEIIKPYDPDEKLEDPYWCEQFAISRWLPGDGLADTLSLKTIITVSANNSGLLNSSKEINFINNLKNINSSIMSVKAINKKNELRKCLDTGSKDFSVLHFAGHGMFEQNVVNNSTIILGKNTSFSPANIHVKFKEERPIIFINACHSGRVGFSFAQLDGWAEKLVEANVGVFIGAMWEVNDELAYKFAETFYTALIQEHLTVGEAFKKSRKVIRDLAPYNSTWLAYSLYAKPEAIIYEKKK